MAVLGFDVQLERFHFCSNTAHFRLLSVISVNKDLREDAGIYRRNHRPRISSIYRSTASRFFTTLLNARKGFADPLPRFCIRMPPTSATNFPTHSVGVFHLCQRLPCAMLNVAIHGLLREPARTTRHRRCCDGIRYHEMHLDSSLRPSRFRTSSE